MNKVVSSFAALAFVIAPTSTVAQDKDWNRYTLENLGGVYIQIEADAVCEGAGVIATAFEASTSLRLIEGEVGVLTRDEMLENPAHPELHISLECAGGSGGSMAFSVGLRVQQAAQMLRDTQVTLPEAVTWYSVKIGVTDAAHVADVVGSALTEALGEFVVAWAAVNVDEGSS